MTKNEIIKKSKDLNVRVYEITRKTIKGVKGWMVNYANILRFRTEEGEHYVDTVSTAKDVYIKGDDLESINEWLGQFPTLDEVREEQDRY